MEKTKPKSVLGKTWYFIWTDNSVWSWIVNILLAFILIKFLVYPGLGLVLGTSYPIVAVVSSSMEHDGNFEEWWSQSEENYAALNITKEDFLSFNMKNGFNRGDIIMLRGTKAENLKKGEIIVFNSKLPEPVIHRVVRVWEDSSFYFQTMGDNYLTNQKSFVKYRNIAGNNVDKDTPGAIKIIDETKISEDELIGKTWFKIPWVGYIKIWFTQLVNLVR